MSERTEAEIAEHARQQLPEHLRIAKANDRRLMVAPPVAGAYGGEVHVYESSAASSPHLWLKVTVANGDDLVAHLTAENAWRLADQLRFLVEHHYQGDARPAEG